MCLRGWLEYIMQDIQIYIIVSVYEFHFVLIDLYDIIILSSINNNTH